VEQADGRQAEEPPDREDVAMGKVDQLDDAVHHRVSEGDQGKDRTVGQPKNQLLDKEPHPSSLWPAMPTGCHTV